MTREMVVGFVQRITMIERDVADLRHNVTVQELSMSDLRYLSRCFDLLKIELDALREYVDGLR
jgi:hypothetical protein